MNAIQVIAITLSILLQAAGAQVPDEETETLLLSSLDKNCLIEKRWYGLIPVQPLALWLVCDSESFLLQTPSNLTGHVKIETTETALEFAYFFSSSDSVELFSTQGMIGFPQDLDPEDWRSDLKKALLAEGVDFSVDINKYEGSSCTGMVSFEIHRTVVATDRKVYRVREYIRGDGYYTRTLETVLYGDIAELGFLVGYT